MKSAQKTHIYRLEGGNTYPLGIGITTNPGCMKTERRKMQTPNVTREIALGNISRIYTLRKEMWEGHLNGMYKKDLKKLAIEHNGLVAVTLYNKNGTRTQWAGGISQASPELRALRLSA